MNNLDKIKKLIWKSHHMGMVENDLIYGYFADNYLLDLEEDLIDDYENLLNNEADMDLFCWATGRYEPKEQYADIIEIVREILPEISN